MYVGNPVFPISFQLEQVAELVEKTLLKKNWKSFEKGEIKLILTPFYLFYYDAVFEEDAKPKGEPQRGRLALNGETAELGTDLAESMPPEEELVKELPDEYPLIVRKPLFSKQEAEKIALLKTASMLNTDRKNIVLTGFKIIYYPMWIAFVTIGGQTQQLEISAVTGEVFGEEKVPGREKGFVEITKETLEELKQPGAWIRYSREITDKTAEKLSGKTKEAGPAKEPASGIKLPSLRHRPWFWITVALIIILIAVALY